MNFALMQTLLAVGGKIVPVLQSIISEIGPALATLGPDVANLVTDANKVLVDIENIFGKLATNVKSAASGTTTKVGP